MADEQMSGVTETSSGLMCQAPPYWAVTLARPGETIDSLAVDMAEAFPDLVRGKEEGRAI
ncbi:MAG: hypothetical protein QOI66_3116, partial [Myxococcales bacterium]|nr:hypothetical protein [Myxococcales bacterium]